LNQYWSFSLSFSSSISQNQRNNATVALVPAQPKLSMNTKSDDEGGEENSQYDDKK
jgi:hypothetical protein